MMQIIQRRSCPSDPFESIQPHRLGLQTADADQSSQGAKTDQTAHTHDPRHMRRFPAPSSSGTKTMTGREERENAPPVAGGSAFLSRGEVARLFGVSVSTVTRWARTGLLPAVRTPGGHYRFRAEDMRRVARSGPPNELLRLD
jgi:excisionase family DNA binding protein